ncbi:MAG TPA: FeoB-associated Cys-rich membrane protein [Dissulfurispiraceae bacterium]|nr:FeoB-associated Cys-rich membrane protein [Dissulfurispiraceae bacterium]
MGVADIFWMALILAAAGYLLYRSLWKKKGHCSGCDGCECQTGTKPPMQQISIRKGEEGNENKSA